MASAAIHEEALQADTDNDSSLDVKSIMTQTTSLTPSVYDFLYEHGHRYHRDGQNPLPNDESEQDRLDLQHHIYKMILKGDLTATKIPDKIRTVLDVGTGTGVWAIEMGDQYPGATITGVDQSPIQPSWVPPNVSFEIDDVTKNWARTPDSLDFIHVRSMAGLIMDWPAFLTEAYQSLAPGGTIEVSDFTTRFQCADGSLTDQSQCKKWEGEFHKFARSIFHMDFETEKHMSEWLEGAGFENVNLVTKLVPIGSWHKDPNLKAIGTFHRAHMTNSGFENYSMALFTKGSTATTIASISSIGQCAAMPDIWA